MARTAALFVSLILQNQQPESLSTAIMWNCTVFPFCESSSFPRVMDSDPILLFAFWGSAKDSPVQDAVSGLFCRGAQTPLLSGRDGGSPGGTEARVSTQSMLPAPWVTAE